MIASGMITHRKADLIRTGGAVIETLNVKASPFDETWHLWRPDPHWEGPRLRAIDVPGYKTAPWSVARAKIAASRLADAPLELKRLRNTV